MVEHEHAEQALRIIENKAPKAGLAVRHENGYVFVKKRALKLHARPPSQGFIDAAIDRMASEICISRISIENNFRDEGTAEKICDTITKIASVQAGTLDFEDAAPSLNHRAKAMALACGTNWEDISDSERVAWIDRAQKLLYYQHQPLQVTL